MLKVARWSAFALATLVATACTGDDPDDYTYDDEDMALFGDGDGKADSAGGGWTDIGLGVAYTQVGDGPGILIAYGGYSAKLSYSAKWSKELVRARLAEGGVGHIYAVQGPRDAGYNAQEIANTKLRAHLKTIDDGEAPIYIVGHSSGSFVAHEVLGQMYRNHETDALGRVVYADLDGGGAGLTSAIVNSLRAVEFVYARDPARGSSQNSSTAKYLGSLYEHASTFEVTVPGTGCNAGAGWCLHDVLITHRPHNPATYDLARDYTDFVNRPITTEYLEPLVDASDSLAGGSPAEGQGGSVDASDSLAGGSPAEGQGGSIDASDSLAGGSPAEGQGGSIDAALLLESPLVDEVGDEGGPAGLMAGPEAGAGVAVEVLEE